MKKHIYIIMLVIMGAGMAMAEGGKVHSEKGTGETSTGSDSQGAADQDRTGSDWIDLFDLLEE
jgi:hypothetical protein